MSKPKDLQPLLDYFGMLERYEQQGFLEVKPDKHEAYITRAALHALAPGKDLQAQLLEAVPQVARHIRTYAAWQTAYSRGVQDYDPRAVADPTVEMPPVSTKELTAYATAPFALHVVKEDAPHDLLYTLLLARRCRWFAPWRQSENIEVITYGKEETNSGRL